MTRAAWTPGQDPSRRLDAVEPGHADVHEHDVGARSRSLGHRLEPVGSLAHDLEAGLGRQDHPEPGADEPLVVDEQDADGHPSVPDSGSRARTAKPPPASGPASSVPPRLTARSRMPAMPRPSAAAVATDAPVSQTVSSSRSGR